MKTKLRKVNVVRGRNHIAFTAYIVKAKKVGIPRSVQKTWKVYCDLAEPDAEMRRLFMTQAQRWRAEKMANWFPSGPPPEVMTEPEMF